MMGASKRIMEFFLMRKSLEIPISTARFANVAFSDGSLLYGFNRRIEKRQPIAAPNDIRRYFVIPQESGELCLMSAIFGENRDIFFPKLSEKLHLITFSEIAVKYLEAKGYEPYLCKNEEEAREFFTTSKFQNLKPKSKYWPVYFFKSDTTGEKDFEEFYTGDEKIDWDRFTNLGVIKNEANFENEKLDYFEYKIDKLRKRGNWDKRELVELFNFMIPNFNHKETGKYLDQRM
jgi:FlaA1/EpsC-like NDP-sugar epimerase